MKDTVARTAAESAAAIAGEAQQAVEALRKEFSGPKLQVKMQEAVSMELGTSAAARDQLLSKVNESLTAFQNSMKEMVTEVLLEYERRMEAKVEELQQLLELISGDAAASREDANTALKAVGQMRSGLAALGTPAKT